MASARISSCSASVGSGSARGALELLDLHVQRFDHGVRREVILLPARGAPGVALGLGPGEAPSIRRARRRSCAGRRDLGQELRIGRACKALLRAHRLAVDAARHVVRGESQNSRFSRCTSSKARTLKRASRMAPIARWRSRRLSFGSIRDVVGFMGRPYALPGAVPAARQIYASRLSALAHRRPAATAATVRADGGEGRRALSAVADAAGPSRRMVAAQALSVRWRTDARPRAGEDGRMQKLLGMALGASLALACGSAGAQLLAPAPVRPDAMMSALTTEVMGTLREDRAAGRDTDLAQLVGKRIVPVFDFPRMTTIALGRNWRVASDGQQARLAAEFQTLLVRTYSQALLEFRDQGITYLPLRAAAGETAVTVRSSLRRSGAPPLTIDYDMADGVAGWRIYDVKIAGVSVVLAYRDSFAATVRESGIDGLIRALEDKNRQNGTGRNGVQAAPLAPVLLLYGASRAPNP
jgi:phospholipid transport system substrate-binding protein